MKIYKLILLILVSVSVSKAQVDSISLEECYLYAEENYPQIKQLELIQQSTEYSLDNAKKGYLPQLSINGQATYQSDVTQLPFQVPGFEVEPLANDQYRLYGEINQPLTDLITVGKQKDFVTANGQVQEQKLEVELYSIRERVNQLYFGILLIDLQREQLDIVLDELTESYESLNAAIRNGVALKSDAASLEIKMIRTEQQIIELDASQSAYRQMLSQFVGKKIDQSAVLSFPESTELNSGINRPELSLMEAQKNLIAAQSDLVNANTLPHLGLFFQGGYGRPGLNFLSNEFTGYYTTGLRLNWNLTGYYTRKKEKQVFTVQQQIIDVQRESFEFNTNILLEQQYSELDRIKLLLEKDMAITQLHEEVITVAQSQLKNGTITTVDFLSKLSAKEQANLTKVNHEVQLLMAQQKIKITTGNF